MNKQNNSYIMKIWAEFEREMTHLDKILEKKL